MIIVQITDTHIKPPGRLAYRRVDTAPFLERAVAAILTLTPRPDVILATGDLVDAGDAEEYERLLDLLRPLDIPLFAVPGNHDERAGLAKAFPDLAARVGGSAFFHYTVEEWPVRLIAMDTVLPGSGAGEVCAERLGWLDARLAEQPERPTIVFQHHPPFDTGIGHMDRLGLSGAADMAAVVRRHPQVERVLCGHLHRPIQVRWAGTIASTAPSTAHQVALDLRDDAPSAFVMEPPGYQIHMWRADTGVVSHTAMVGDYDGPYPFFKDGKLID